MNKRGYSVFQKLFFSFMCVGTIAIFISGVANYRSKTEFVRHTISSHLVGHGEACTNLFTRTYTEPIQKDLKLIDSSPTVNDFLASKQDAILLMRPQVERLFLHFTGEEQDLYQSMRLIDAKGEERVVTEGGKRVKNYVSVQRPSDDLFYRRVGSLFERLRKVEPRTVLTEGPFMYGNNRSTFLVGISKREPEIGGFGGAVVVHCDLTGYLDYLSKVCFNDMQTAWVLSPDNQVLLSPTKSHVFSGQRLNLSELEKINHKYARAFPLVLDSQSGLFLNLVLSIPEEISSRELTKALWTSTWMVASIVVLVSIMTAFISKRFIVDPIGLLSRGVQRIGEGDLDYQISIDGSRDEIGGLADAFNTMTRRLRQTLDNLKAEVDERKRAQQGLQSAHDDLETRVKERTAELAKANQELQIEVADRKIAEKALYESDQRFRELFENMSTCVAVYEAKENGRDFMFKDLNRAAERAENVSRHDLIGKGVLDVFPAVKEFGLFDVFQRVWETGTPEEHPISAYKDNRIVGWRHNYVYKLPSGEIVAVYTDETARKQAEEDKKILERQLQQAHKMEAIGTLAGGIAHDFNNILAAITGFVELAKLDAEENSQSHDNLVEALRAAKRAKALVQQMLTFSRQNAAEPKPLKVSLIVKEALALIRASIPATVEIRQNIQQEGSVLADSTQIHQVLMNLCSNAAYAMRETGGVLEVSLQDILIDAELKDQFPDLPTGPYMRLSVSDTGPGIDETIKGRIFDPFFTTKGPGEGTGMGLAVVHGIVKNHNGVVIVESEPGRGSVFHVFLPRLEREIREETATVAPLATGTERILLVDDEQALVRIGEQMLRRLGYDVVARTSSVEALEVFRSQPDKFALVITDLTMPNMTGDQLIWELTQIRRDIPVILCTGYSEIMSEEKIRSLGVDGFAMKPVVMTDLASTIRRVLDRV